VTDAAALRSEAFEARYRGGADPWSFAQSAYERSRYQTILNALGRSRYLAAYEPGCSVGVLTQRLAAVAAHVIAIDFAPSAVMQARRRCAHLAHVDIRCADLAQFVPGMPLDLIVFSEVGYYLSYSGLSQLAARLATCLKSGGEFVAAHWLGNSEDHLLHGTRVHEILRQHLGLHPRKSAVHAGFCLDTWVAA
jgi:SAM-dependent methyltransferase